jgi:hypothetical protein
VSVKAYPPDSPGRAQEIPTVNTPGGAGGTIATQDEGISVDAAATTLNFVGAGVTATDAGSNVTTVTIPGGSGAPVDAEYVVMSLNGTLTNERRLQATTPIVLTDGGANADATLTHATSGVAAATYGTSLKVAQVAINATGHTTTAADVDIATLVGDSGAGGTKGLVPAPATGDAAAHKFLKADGTWKNIVNAGGTAVSNVFGSGIDGVINFDGVNTFSFASLVGSTYTLTNSFSATDCTVSNGITVKADGHVGWVNGTLTLTGTALWHNNGGNGGSPVGGSATNANFNGSSGGGGAGSTTGAATGGTATTFSTAGTGASGGTSPAGAGAIPGAVTVPTAANGGTAYIGTLVAGLNGCAGNGTNWRGGSGGGGARGSATGSGGGGGAGGGALLVPARFIAGAGTISATGGRGGDGQVAATNAGSGGGGGGGLIWIVTTTATLPVTTSVVGGGPGTPRGTGTAGGTGTDGQVFHIVIA